MKRPNGAGTVRKLSGKRRRPWAAVITTGWDQETGKRLQKYIGYYETYQEAELALAVYRSDPLSKDDLTLEMVYAEWKVVHLRGLSKQAHDSYSSAWRHLSQLQHLKMKDIRTGQLQMVIDTARTAAGKPYSRATLSMYKTLAVMLWDYALQNDIVEKNYAHYIVLPKVERKEKERFSALEVEKIKQAAHDGFPIADCIYIMIMSGFRLTEFLSLDRFTVDVERMTFTGGVKTDTGRNRVVPIHPHILPYVCSRLAQGGERMVCKPDGSAYTPTSFRRIYYKALEGIGVRHLTPHATRHTFASMLAEAQVPPVEIQRLLGHTDYAMTANVYTHVDVEALRKAVGSL